MTKRMDQLASRIALLTLSWSGYALSQEAPPATSPAPEATQPSVAGEQQVVTETPETIESPTEVNADKLAPEETAEVVGEEVAAEESSQVTDRQEETRTEGEVSEALEPVPDAPKVESTASYINPKLSIGVGLRVGYVFDTNVPDQNFGQSVGTNIRPYIGGSISEHIKFAANLDSSLQVAGGDTVAAVRLLDAQLQLEFDDLVNFWVGRLLPPSDRANLSGPYFQNAWNYPVQANLFPAIYAGRHDGVVYWGQVGGGAFKWQLGAFDMTGGDNPLLTGRLVLNLLDPEPGYYNSSTYYGTKDILALAGTIHYQKGGDTATGTGIDGAALEAELLFEKELNGSGTITAEGAYYNFTNTDQGQSVNALLSYLLPGKQGVGTLQPLVRLQMMMPSAGDSYATVDGSLNYIVDGHNARFTLNYQYIAEHDGVDADSLITLGGQLQVF